MYATTRGDIYSYTYHNTHQASLSDQTEISIELSLHWPHSMLQCLDPFLLRAAELYCDVILYPPSF